MQARNLIFSVITSVIPVGRVSDKGNISITPTLSALLVSQGGEMTVMMMMMMMKVMMNVRTLSQEFRTG